MKLKDLLKGRDKLRKYEELEKWQGYFNSDTICVTNMPPSIERLGYVTTTYLTLIPANIKQIILDAIDAEMKKMEEE